MNGDQAFWDNHEIALAGRHTEIVFDSIFGLHADLEVSVSCEELEHLDHAIDLDPSLSSWSQIPHSHSAIC